MVVRRIPSDYRCKLLSTFRPFDCPFLHPSKSSVRSLTYRGELFRDVDNSRTRGRSSSKFLRFVAGTFVHETRNCHFPRSLEHSCGDFAMGPEFDVIRCSLHRDKVYRNADNLRPHGPFSLKFLRSIARISSRRRKIISERMARIVSIIKILSIYRTVIRRRIPTTLGQKSLENDARGIRPHDLIIFVRRRCSIPGLNIDHRELLTGAAVLFVRNSETRRFNLFSSRKRIRN